MQRDDLRTKLRDAGHYVSPRDDVGNDAAAWLLGLSPRTLDNWRPLRKGPLYARIGKRVWYPLGAIVDYLTERIQQLESSRR